MEVTPSCREHQPEHPTEVSWALQPRRHGRERAERGGQGTNPGRVRDRDAAREDLTEVARGQAGHDPVHLLGGRTERRARRRTRNASRPRGVAGARRGRVPGTACRCAAARRQHDHSADGDHGQHPPYGRVQRPAPPASRICRLAMTHHRSLPSLSPSCRGCALRGLVRPVRPCRRPRLQDWTGHSPPWFLRVGQSQKWFICARRARHYLARLGRLVAFPRSGGFRDGQRGQGGNPVGDDPEADAHRSGPAAPAFTPRRHARQAGNAQQPPMPNPPDCRGSHGRQARRGSPARRYVRCRGRAPPAQTCAPRAPAAGRREACWPGR